MANWFSRLLAVTGWSVPEAAKRIGVSPSLAGKMAYKGAVATPATQARAKIALQAMIEELRPFIAPPDADAPAVVIRLPDADAVLHVTHAAARALMASGGLDLDPHGQLVLRPDANLAHALSTPPG